jgi:hypothetical protein
MKQNEKVAERPSKFVLELRNVWHGFLDAFFFVYPVLVLYKSHTIRKLTFSCVFLNGFIFLGSILLLRMIGVPLSRYFLDLIADDALKSSLSGGVADGVLDFAFNVCW